jgi:hypothetical protein
MAANGRSLRACVEQAQASNAGLAGAGMAVSNLVWRVEFSLTSSRPTTGELPSATASVRKAPLTKGATYRPTPA